MSRPSIFSIALLAAVVVAAPALAQEAQLPRPTGGLFGGLRPTDPRNPDLVTQQLMLGVDVSGGFDGVRGSEISSQFNQAGLIGVTTSELRHHWGNAHNFLESFARGNLTFANEGVSRQTTATSQVQGAFAMGKRAGATLQFDAGYQPTYLFNAFGPLDGQLTESLDPAAPVPGAELDHGFSEERWVMTGGGATLHRNWTPRQITTGHYNTIRRTQVDERENVSLSRAVGLRHDWLYRERAALHMSYQFDENEQRGEVGTPEPVRTHRGNVDLQFSKRLPRNRVLSFSFGGGATQLRTHETPLLPPTDFIVPSFAGRVQAQMSTAWVWSVDVNRDVTILEGLTLTPFVTNVGSLSLRGRLGRSVEFTSTAAYSRGLAEDGSVGEFKTLLGSAGLLFPLGRLFSVTTSYSYYSHDFFDLSELQPLLPPHQRRHSVRAGVRVWLPLFGTY